MKSCLKINELKKGKIKPKHKDQKERIQFTYEAWNEYKEKHLKKVKYLKKNLYR